MKTVKSTYYPPESSRAIKTKVSKSTEQFFYITLAKACQENTTGSGEEN